MKVTLDHIRRAAEWAIKTGNKPRRIGNKKRAYNQSTWDCGTACCIWGAACILAGKPLGRSGNPLQPRNRSSADWQRLDKEHPEIIGLLGYWMTKPEEVLDAVKEAMGGEARKERHA